MLRSLISGAAMTAAILAAGAAAAPAQAQDQTRQYDGYCYVRAEDMANDAATAPCLNGEYYAYTDSYRAAPRAPDGFQVEYFTRRPTHDVYDHVYNASTLTDNFEPGASNHFGAGDGGGYAYTGDTNRRYDQAAVQDQDNYNPPYDRDAQAGAVGDGRDSGWRDDRGQWHLGQPAALGWRDEGGRWHVGRVAAYGWQDDRGQWHEQAPENGPNSDN